MSPKRKRLLAEIEQYKRRASADLFYFDKYVLGYNLMLERVHTRICRFVQQGYEDFKKGGKQITLLILTPRNSFKSRAITIGATLWMLADDPNLTFMLTNEKLDKTKEFLGEIKAHITSNPKFKTLFGDWSCDKKIGKRWSASRIDIAGRKVVSGTASIEASSTTSSEAGKHVDVLICDDLHGLENTRTIDQIEKVIGYYRELASVLKPTGLRIVIGTRWDYRDLYQFIIDIDKELGDLSGVRILIEKARDENETLWFPEVLSEEFLQQQRVLRGFYEFNCQYMNEPVGRDNASVKLIDKYNDKQKFDNHNNFVTLDLAYTDNKRSDSTAIVVNSVDCTTGKWYIRHYDVFKTTDPDKVIEKMFEIEARYKPVRWGIEKNNYISWLKKSLMDAMRKRGIYLNIDPEDGLAHYGTLQGKTLRLRVIGTQFNYRMAAIHESMTDLEDQLLRLTYDGPRGHDDLLDALAMQGEIAFWGNGAPTTKRDNERAIAADPRSRFASEHAKRFCVALDYTDEEREDEWLYA